MRAVLNPSGVHDHRSRSAAEHFRGGEDALGRHSCNTLCHLRSVWIDGSFHLVPVTRAGGNVLLVREPLGNYVTQHCVQDGYVCAGPERQPEIGCSCGGRLSRIHDDEFGAVITRSPKPLHHYGKAFGYVGAGRECNLFRVCPSWETARGPNRTLSNRPRLPRTCRAGRCNLCAWSQGRHGGIRPSIHFSFVIDAAVNGDGILAVLLL